MPTQLQEPNEVQEVQEVKVQCPKRLELSAEESLKRMEAFPERKEQFIAAICSNRKKSAALSLPLETVRPHSHNPPRLPH